MVENVKGSPRSGYQEINLSNLTQANAIEAKIDQLIKSSQENLSDQKIENALNNLKDAFSLLADKKNHALPKEILARLESKLGSAYKQIPRFDANTNRKAAAFKAKFDIQKPWNDPQFKDAGDTVIIREIQAQRNRPNFSVNEVGNIKIKLIKGQLVTPEEATNAFSKSGIIFKGAPTNESLEAAITIAEKLRITYRDNPENLAEAVNEASGLAAQHNLTLEVDSETKVDEPKKAPQSPAPAPTPKKEQSVRILNNIFSLASPSQGARVIDQGRLNSTARDPQELRKYGIEVKAGYNIAEVRKALGFLFNLAQEIDTANKADKNSNKHLASSLWYKNSLSDISKNSNGTINITSI